jgi:predicted permease
MRWLRPILRRNDVESEMDLEMRVHFDQLVEDYIRRGMTPDDARRQARLDFGGIGQIKDDAREARLADRFDRAVRGLRLAARNLLKSLGFTAVAIVTLALGIGVNTAMYSLFDQLLLRDLPVRDPGRLVVLHGNFSTPGMYRGNERMISFSWPKYVGFRDHGDVFTGVAARFAVPGVLEHRGAAERVDVELVTGNFFDVIGAGAAAGRVLVPSDAVTPMGHPVVVLGHSYWQRRFAGDRGIVGQQVRVNGMAVTVIGVSAAGLHSVDRGAEVDVWASMMMKDLFTPTWRGIAQPSWAWLQIVARVKPGMPLRQAQAGANILYKQLLEEQAKTLSARYRRRREFLDDHVDLIPAAAGFQDQNGGQRAFFLELMGIGGVVLLIACVNLAGLLLARTAARQREIAIRLALGAGRMGVVRQLLAENLLVAVIGGAAGVWLAAALAPAAVRLLVAPQRGRLVGAPLDPRVLLFALSVTILTAAAFAILPALQLGRTDLADVLRSENGASSSRAQVRLRKALVIAQLAFCVWLMIAAGLFTRSLAQLRSTDLGFRREHLVTFTLDPMISGYQPEQSIAAYRRLNAALAALPGVTAVGMSDYGVFSGINNMNLEIEGYLPPPPDASAQVRELIVSQQYFRAMGMQLTGGRNFTDADMQPPIKTAMVNQAFADRYFPGQNAIGRHIGGPGQKLPWEIVGVVRNCRYFGPSDSEAPFYYLSSEQNGRLSIYVRTAQAPEAMLAAVGRVAAREMPGVPVDRLRTMEDLFDFNIGEKSRIASLAGFFGLLATLLAAIGLYGVIAFTVARRTREIGIRMAIGAARGHVLWMVIREVGAVIAGGLIVGLPTGWAVTRLIRSQLYNVSPLDARAALVAVATVGVIALAAGFLPARRATRVDPVRALRWE